MGNMSHPFILDEKTLKRIPPAFVLILVLILGLPAIFLNYYGLDFNTLSKALGTNDQAALLISEAQIRGYFRETLLQWSAFSLASITVLLSFTKYRLTNDKIALIIGLVVLFSGSVEALHTLLVDGLSPDSADKANLDAVIWTFSNIFSGLIFIIGLLLLLFYQKQNRFRSLTFVLISLLLLLIAFSLIYYATTLITLPEMWFVNDLLARPYELIYLLLYLFLVIFIYPAIYKQYPYILTNCIFYMAITQMVSAIYLMLLSGSPYDSAYDIAYFLKIIVYFIPCACLIVDYVFSYNAVLEAQDLLKTNQIQLTYLAAHDGLTDLYNRREFENLLGKAIANSARNKSMFALFVIDIDNFKLINDSLGHSHGDHFLKELSSQLTSLSRQGDILSRIGGDEFTLITAKLKSPTAAKKLAKRIVAGLSTPLIVDEKTLVGTVSIGISIYSMDGETTEELLKNADIAMYKAKNSGKNNFRFYSEQLND